MTLVFAFIAGMAVGVVATIAGAAYALGIWRPWS
jgi:hypothetical protein